MGKITYSKAGVDINKVKKSHKKTWNQIMETFDLRNGKIGQPLKVFGHYAGLIEIDGSKVLALHTDGVGTKVLVSQVLEKYDTIGIDAVAMGVNDVICVGAEPIALVDYLALEKTNDKIVEEIMKGLVEGAKQADTVIIGGETAIMPDVIKGIDNKGFDLAVTVLGIVNKDKIITGEKMRPGDVVIGLESSGIHSNGLSLARKVVPKENYDQLLIPTKIYVKPVLEIVKNCDVHGLANITGGAFSKLMRIGEKANVGFSLDNIPEPQGIFKLIQKFANISDREMYRTFNCGIGFVVVVPEGDVKKVVEICGNHDIKAMKIGEVIGERDVKIKTPSGIISVI